LEFEEKKKTIFDMILMILDDVITFLKAIRIVFLKDLLV